MFWSGRGKAFANAVFDERPRALWFGRHCQRIPNVVQELTCGSGCGPQVTEMALAHALKSAPDKQDKATLTVLEQAEVLSAGWAAL